MDNSGGALSMSVLARKQLGGEGIGPVRSGGLAGESSGGWPFAEAERHADGHEQLSQIQRARILAAMTDVVSREGVGRATAARVVACSGVSRRTFYEQFVDREDCFLAAFDHAIERIAAVVVPAYREPLKWHERVRAGLAQLLWFLEGEPNVARLVVVEALGAGPRALEHRRQGIAQIVAVVDSEGREAKAGEGPPPLTGEGVVGGVLSLIHARLAPGATLTRRRGSSTDPVHPDGSSGLGEVGLLVELLNPLVSMIVSPYLGPAAARRELGRPTPAVHGPTRAVGNEPLGNLGMRLTYRTVRVLRAIGGLDGQGSHPSNRQVADAADIRDQGQVSKLLARLQQVGLIENAANPRVKGEPNAWALTDRGAELCEAVSS
jgi:AcrR family transcriptional regulator